MKVKKLILIFTCVILGQAHASLPVDTTDYYRKVEAFIPIDTLNCSYFYSEYKGEIMDSVKSISGDDWIIVTIDSVKNDWVKLKKVVMMESGWSPPALHNVWAPISMLYTGLNDPAGTFKVHVSPSKKSKQLVYPTTFGPLKIVDIEGFWIKFKFNVDGKEHSGWKNKYNLCAYPWTVCL
jgi:hypothetical protein